MMSGFEPPGTRRLGPLVTESQFGDRCDVTPAYVTPADVTRLQVMAARHGTIAAGPIMAFCREGTLALT